MKKQLLELINKNYETNLRFTRRNGDAIGTSMKKLCGNKRPNIHRNTNTLCWICILTTVHFRVFHFLDEEIKTAFDLLRSVIGWRSWLGLGFEMKVDLMIKMREKKKKKKREFEEKGTKEFVIWKCGFWNVDVEGFGFKWIWGNGSRPNSNVEWDHARVTWWRENKWDS